MKNLRKSTVFQGLEKVQAPRLEQLGPQSHAREGSGQPKLHRTGPPEGSGHYFLGLLDDVAAKVTIS